MTDPIRILNHAETLLARSKAAFSRTSKRRPDPRADRARPDLMTPVERSYYEAAREAMLTIRDMVSHRKPAANVAPENSLSDES